MIPYGKQWLDDSDIEEVVKVLKSDWLTQGPTVKRFEDATAKYTGARYAVAVSNGTAALHIAVAALELPAGTEGITSPITFLASANAMLYNGLHPVFADIEPDTYNINPSKIEEKISTKTRLLIPVHFSGQPADIEKIYDIAKKHNLKIIEDAAHALGSEYIDSSGIRHKVGDCAFSDMTILSFHPVKHITTGEGGMVLTNSEELYEKLLMLRSHGVTKTPKNLTKNDGPWYYEMQMLGYNYRITDFQCALGLSQLKKLDKFVSRRREIVEMYNGAFKDITQILTPFEKNGVKSAYHLYVIRLKNISRLEFYNILRAKDILCQVHYIPVHLQPYYKKELGYKEGNYPEAEEYYKEAISLPLYPKMSDSDVAHVINTVGYAVAELAG